jgi:hypothetical protein
VPSTTTSEARLASRCTPSNGLPTRSSGRLTERLYEPSSPPTPTDNTPNRRCKSSLVHGAAGTQRTLKVQSSGLRDPPTTPEVHLRWLWDLSRFKTTQPVHNTSTVTRAVNGRLSNQSAAPSFPAATSPSQTRQPSPLLPLVNPSPSLPTRPAMIPAPASTRGSQEQLPLRRSPPSPTTPVCQLDGLSPIPERLCPPAQLLSVSLFFPYAPVRYPPATTRANMLPRFPKPLPLRNRRQLRLRIRLPILNPRSSLRTTIKALPR